MYINMKKLSLLRATFIRFTRNVKNETGPRFVGDLAEICLKSFKIFFLSQVEIHERHLHRDKTELEFFKH